jgi:hypothetical protein
MSIISKANISCSDQKNSKSIQSLEQSDEEGETIIVGDGAESKAGESTPKAQPGERSLQIAETSKH